MQMVAIAFLRAGLYFDEFPNDSLTPIAVESISWGIALGGHVDELILPVSSFQNTHIRIRRNGSAAICAYGRVVFTQFFQTRLADHGVEDKNFLPLIFQKCRNGCHRYSAFPARRIFCWVHYMKKRIN